MSYYDPWKDYLKLGSILVNMTDDTDIWGFPIRGAADEDEHLPPPPLSALQYHHQHDQRQNSSSSCCPGQICRAVGEPSCSINREFPCVPTTPTSTPAPPVRASSPRFSPVVAPPTLQADQERYTALCATSDITLAAGSSPPVSRILTTRYYRSSGEAIAAAGAPQRRKNIQYCVFCKMNGEMDTVFMSHILKDTIGRTTCPYLRKYTCPMCGASGDDAHTIKYCPLNFEGIALPRWRQQERPVEENEHVKTVPSLAGLHGLCTW